MLKINQAQKAYSIYKLVLISLFLFSCSTQIVGKKLDSVKTETISTSITPENSPISITVQSALPLRTPTALISHTPTSTSSPTHLNLLMRSRYIVINDYNQAVLLVDVTTGNYRFLKSDSIQPVRVLTFKNDGCELIVKLGDNSIVQVNLNAQVTKVFLPPDWYHGKENILKEAISFSGDWLAYIVGQGNQGYNSYEKFDVEIIDLVDRTVFQLTEHGGAWEVAWSKVGDWVAYSDFDENNINQIYITHGDGKEKHKLTSFRNSNDRILLLRWSPEGTKLAFQRYNITDQSISFGVVLIDDTKGILKTFPDVPSGVRNLWWQDDDVLAIHTIPIDNTLAEGEGGIIWLQSSTGKIVNMFRESETPERTIRSANFFDKSVIVFFSDRGFFTYNLGTKTTQRNFDNYLNYSEWIVAPTTFPGEQNCTSN